MLAEQQKPIICGVTMARTNQRTQSPLKTSEGHVASNSLEKIYPGIYLTGCLNAYTADDLNVNGFTHIIYIDKHISDGIQVDCNANNAVATGGPNFDILDLNFGESSYLTTVIPKVAKAVKFIEKAAGELILFVGGKHICVTIIVGYLMFKHNKNFLNAYAMLHPNIELELDKFYIRQLYEYEVILQVQRTQSGGNSCSRELRSALLKRKRSDTILPPTILCSDGFRMNIDQSDILME